MRLKPFTIPCYSTVVRNRPGVLRQSNPNLIRCTAGDQQHALPTADILVLDATNILSRAAIDAKRCKAIPEVSIRFCFEIWVDFMIAATAATSQRRLVVAVFDNPAAGGNRKQLKSDDYLRRRRGRRQRNTPPLINAGKLKPFIETIESLEGGVALLAGGGYEADECIGAVCALLTESSTVQNSSSALKNIHLSNDGPVSIVIASGDSDMQQYLTSTISLLDIAPLPTLASPSALSSVTEASFLSKNNFPASAYTDYLALVGKKEASIGGVGLGSSLATKLLAQFHSIEGIEHAAQQGILKGWPPVVKSIFLKNKATAGGQLERNREIFTSVTDPEIVLTSEQREKLLAARKKNCRTTTTSSRDAAAALAWQHPIYALRWLQAGPLIPKLVSKLESRNIGPCQVQAVTSKGLPIDLIINSSSSGSGDGGVAVMVCVACDFSSPTAEIRPEEKHQVQLNSILDDIEAATKDKERQIQGVHDLSRVGKELNRAAQHHINLLKKAGSGVVLIPWWLLQYKDV